MRLTPAHQMTATFILLLLSAAMMGFVPLFWKLMLLFFQTGCAGYMLYLFNWKL
jgi:hypothetical protein